jgi:flagellar basal body-associated protein FliL
MDKTKIIIIVFIVLIIIALGVLGFLYFRKAPTEPVTEAPVSETEPPARESISPGPETQPRADPEFSQDFCRTVWHFFQPGWIPKH